MNETHEEFQLRHNRSMLDYWTKMVRLWATVHTWNGKRRLEYARQQAAWYDAKQSEIEATDRERASTI